MTSKLTSFAMIQANNYKLYTEQEGNSGGPSILFIHGLGGTTNTFQPILSPLQDFNLIRFDFAGHGRSETPEKTSIDSYVEDCEAVIAHYSLTSLTVVAHSLGCLIALNLAAKLGTTYPHLMKALVLFGPVPSPPPSVKAGCIARAQVVRNSGMAAITDAVVANGFSEKTLTSNLIAVAFARELLSRQTKEGYALALEALGSSVSPAWENVKAKTTIVSGIDDKVSSAEVAGFVKGKLEGNANVEVVSWVGVGHWHTLEKPLEAGLVVRKAVLA